jgi:predicted RNA-binding Zn ribbon-like protein
MSATTCSLDSTPGLGLVREFANSIDLETGTDALDGPQTFASWLAEHDHDARHGVAPADLELAIALRTALRAELAAHHDGGSDAAARDRLAAIAQALPLAVDTCGDGTPQLVPIGQSTPARAYLSAVLAGMAAAGFAGTWHRLKLCPADDCGWAFYDESRNRSRRWCSMEVCGNRSKTRHYRARHGHGDDPVQ